MENSSDYSKLLSGLMSDPEAMSGVLNIARNLMGGTQSQDNSAAPQAAAEVAAPEHEDSVKAVASPISAIIGDREQSEHREKLLSALRPYLNHERSDMVDMILKLMKLAKVADIGALLGNLK